MSKKVLITGASRGLGKVMVERFASNGYDVILNYNNTDVTEYITYLKDKYNVKVYYFKADVSNEFDVMRMTKYIKCNIGNIDILINNAAKARDNECSEKSIDEFMDVVKTNLGGTFLMCKYASYMMDKGLIINISSTDSINTYSPISIDYCASKAGVNNLCKTFSIALDKIKVIGLLLPWINTESVLEMDKNYLESELKRIGQDKLLDKCEVANKIFELANKNEGFDSGSIIELGSDYKWILK